MPRRSRLGPILLLAAALTATFFTYQFRSPPAAPPSESIVPTEAPTVEAGRLDGLIRSYEDRVADHTTPSDYAILGRLYHQRARQGGGVDDYVRAQNALFTALDLFPEDPSAGVALAEVDLSLHEFAGALESAGKLLETNPDLLAAVAIVGDAQLAVGEIDRAAEAYARLQSERPTDPSVLIRLSRLEFIRGRTESALNLADQAAASASKTSSGPGLAWFLAASGRVAFDSGDLDRSASLYDEALDADPNSRPALAGMAIVASARGELAGAIDLLERAIAIVPEPDQLAALGDLYSVSGREDEADVQFATVEVIGRLNESQGVFDRSLAYFYADHGVSVEEALRITEDGLERRHDIYAYDARAWALHAAGRYDEARQASDEALTLGTEDAAIWYHAGMISLALGDEDRATTELEKALDINGGFSLVQGERARQALASIREE